MIIPLKLVDMPRSHCGSLRERGHDRIELHASHLSPVTRCRLHAVWDGMCDAEQLKSWDDITEAVIRRTMEWWQTANRQSLHHLQSARPVRQLVECLPIAPHLRKLYSNRYLCDKRDHDQGGRGRKNKREERVVYWPSYGMMSRTQRALLREQAEWATQYPGLFRARDEECYTREMRDIVTRWTAGMPRVVGALCGAALCRLLCADVASVDGVLEVDVEMLQTVLRDVVLDAYDAGDQKLTPTEGPQ